MSRRNIEQRIGGELMGPEVLAAVSLGSMAAGSGVSAFGSLFGGQAQKGMYEYQAGLAQMNAQIAHQNAIYSTQAGEAQAMRSGMRTREQIGETLTRQAASGIDVNQGSGLAVRRSEQALGAYDEAAIRSSAARQAYGYRAQGFMDEQQSVLDQFAAKNAVRAGQIGAASSILGGMGSVSSKWLGLSDQFGWGKPTPGGQGTPTWDTTGATWG